MRRVGSWPGQRLGELGEVEDRRAALDAQRGDVVRARSHLRGCKSAQPDPVLLLGLADLGHPPSPGPHPDAPVDRVLAVVPGPLGPRLGLVGPDDGARHGRPGRGQRGGL